MDHLSKQQLVLLALLLSFVTSLATGIVTVSLMDQAPQGMTRTISQVIERTIQQAAPQGASAGTVTLSVDDQLAAAAAKASSSIVKIKIPGSDTVSAMGVIVSKDGVIMTDSSVAPLFTQLSVVLSDGTVVAENPIQGQGTGDIIFLAPLPALAGSSAQAYVPASLADSFDLGQSVYSIAGTSTMILGHGEIMETNGTSSPIATSIPTGKTAIGSALFDIRGNILGIRTSSSASADGGASFIPIAPLQALIPVSRQ